MPNKHNFDVLELIRGNVSIFYGYQYQLQEVIKNLFSGYNRDSQLTKEPYMKAIDLVMKTLDVFIVCIDNLFVHKKNIEQACSDNIYATEKAYKLVQQGTSFREAYNIAKKTMK